MEPLLLWPDNENIVGVVVEGWNGGFDELACMLAGRLSSFASLVLSGHVGICWAGEDEGRAGREVLGGGCEGFEVWWLLVWKERGAGREYSREEKRRGNCWADRVDDSSGRVLGGLALVLIQL